MCKYLNKRRSNMITDLSKVPLDDEKCNIEECRFDGICTGENAEDNGCPYNEGYKYGYIAGQKAAIKEMLSDIKSSVMDINTVIKFMEDIIK
jgi:hypothetical protein